MNKNDSCKIQDFSLVRFLSLIEVGSTNIIVSMGPRIVEMRFTWDHPFITYAWREDSSNFHMYLDIKQRE